MHTELNKFKLEEWNEIWTNLEEAKQTKLWFPRKDKALSKDLLKLSRVSLGQIIGFITWILLCPSGGSTLVILTFGVMYLST